LGALVSDVVGASPGVGLAEAIEALRAELVEAMSKAPKVGLRFKPGPVQVTLQVSVTKNAGGKAGIKWWLVEAGADASRGSASTQTVTVSLQPVYLDEHGEVRDVLVSGEDTSNPGLSAGPSWPSGGVE
jgi:hypothetical protein